MITSSLPPELKVLIASGFLLGGGLFAQRYPADREEELASPQTVVVKRNETPTSPTTSQEPTSMASGIDEGTRFDSIEQFVNDNDYGEWSYTSMSESGATMSVAQAFEIEETFELDPGHYGGTAIGRTNMESTADQETAQIAEYIPFQPSPVTMPEPNPAFFAERPAPPNLTGLSPLPGEFESNVVIPRAVVAPSAVMQSGVLPASRVTPIATTVPGTTTMARPVTQKPEATTDLQLSNIVPPPKELRGNVIVAPARTTILPNPPTNL